MQTFLPFPSFVASAAALDYRRLGKQRLEAQQLYKALTGVTTGWSRHPAALMWTGHLSALALYGLTMSLEWRARGYADNLAPWFLARVTGLVVLPSWIGAEDFHLAHQSNLVRKFSAYYGPRFPGVSPSLPYVWPRNSLAA